MTDRRKLLTATFLGVSIAVMKAPFHWPITDYLIILEAPILGLSFLLLGRGGATYAGFVNGALQSAVKVEYFPWVLVFGVSYGILIDFFCTILQARTEESTSVRRMASALALASMVTGLGIAYAVLSLGVYLGPTVASVATLTQSQLIDFVYLPIVAWGILSGGIAGFISARVWERNLKSRFKSIQTR